MRASELRSHIVEKRPHLATSRICAAFLVGGFSHFKVAQPALVQYGQPRHGIEQRGNHTRQMRVENACALRAAKDEHVRRTAWSREREELSAHGHAGELGMAEPLCSGGKVDRRGLY